MSKPQQADQYAPQQIQAVRAVCSELASALGDLSDELVVVGGLVPSLLIDAGRTGGETHVGTMDLDIGLNIGLPNHAHYARLSARLRPLLDDWDAQRAIEHLRADFADIDSPGPLAVARFVARPDDEGFRADVAGAVRGLLDGL